MPDKQALDLSKVESLLTSPENSQLLLPVAAIRESDHAFFWGAFFLAIATCLFGCAAALYAAAYDHMPFIIMIECFGAMFFIFFAAFVIRGLRIRRKSRAHEKRRLPREILYPYARDTRYEGGAGFERLQASIQQELNDGVARSREEIIGILSRISTAEVDVGTLNQVVNALVEAGMLTEIESGGRKLFTYNSQAAA